MCPRRFLLGSFREKRAKGRRSEMTKSLDLCGDFLEQNLKSRGFVLSPLGGMLLAFCHVQGRELLAWEFFATEVVHFEIQRTPLIICSILGAPGKFLLLPCWLVAVLNLTMVSRGSHFLGFFGSPFSTR